MQVIKLRNLLHLNPSLQIWVHEGKLWAHLTLDGETVYNGAQAGLGKAAAKWLRERAEAELAALDAQEAAVDDLFARVFG